MVLVGLLAITMVTTGYAAENMPTITYKLQNFESYAVGDVVKDSHSPDLKDLEVVTGGYQNSKAMRMVRSIAGTGHNIFFNDTLTSLFGNLPKKVAIDGKGEGTEYYMDYSVADGLMLYVKSLSRKSESHITFAADFRYDNKGKIASYQLNVGRGAKVYSLSGKDITDSVVIDWYGENYFKMTPGLECWIQIPTTAGEANENKGWKYATAAEVAAARGKLDFKYMASLILFADEAADVLIDEVGFYGKVSVSNGETDSSSATVSKNSSSPVSTNTVSETISTVSSSKVSSTTDVLQVSSAAIESETSFVVSEGQITSSETTSEAAEAVESDPEDSKGSSGWIVLIVILAVFVLAGAGVLLYWKFYIKNKSEQKS